MTTYTGDQSTTYTGRPLTKLYDAGCPADIVVDYPSMLDLFQASLTRAPDSVAIKYFDRVLTMTDLDTRSDALALALSDQGFSAGDRLGVYVQNNPAFVVGLLAAWKAGGVAVLINPMNKRGELAAVLTDSGASALLCLDDLYESVAKELIATGETEITTVISCSALDERSRNDERLFAGAQRTRPEGTLDLEEIYGDYAGRKPAPVNPDTDDVAVLCYTSGTTGAPKGAMCTHGAMSFNSQTYRDWMGLTAADSVLGVAPLFHITGLIGHMGAAMIAACPDVIYGHPAIHEVAVVGVPDEYRGESVKAYISRKAGQALTEEELIAFCKGQMAAYKYPRSVEFLDDLPKTTSGKILRRELRDLNWK